VPEFVALGLDRRTCVNARVYPPSGGKRWANGRANEPAHAFFGLMMPRSTVLRHLKALVAMGRISRIVRVQRSGAKT
jgi:hypothetical protein